LSSVWKTYLSKASSDWSKSAVLETTIVAGQSTSKRCRATSWLHARNSTRPLDPADARNHDRRLEKATALGSENLPVEWGSSSLSGRKWVLGAMPLRAADVPNWNGG